MFRKCSYSSDCRQSGVSLQSCIEQRAPIVTTSWDDGHPLDMRVAKLLSAHEMRGTFYVLLNHLRIPATKLDLRTLREMGMEIGSHGIWHKRLTGRKDVFQEVLTSRHRLESLLGEPVVSFSYPKGAFDRAARNAVRQAGYRLARTTVAFGTEASFDPFSMPVSFQLLPHSGLAHTSHAIKQYDARGLLAWWLLYRGERDLVRLAELMINRVLKTKGILHIWGHSQEIEQLGLWNVLTSVLEVVSGRSGVRYLTNSQVLDAIAT